MVTRGSRSTGGSIVLAQASHLVLCGHMRAHARAAPLPCRQAAGCLHERLPHASPAVPLVHDHIQHKGRILRACTRVGSCPGTYPEDCIAATTVLLLPCMHCRTVLLCMMLSESHPTCIVACACVWCQMLIMKRIVPGHLWHMLPPRAAAACRWLGVERADNGA